MQKVVVSLALAFLALPNLLFAESGAIALRQRIRSDVGRKAPPKIDGRVFAVQNAIGTRGISTVTGRKVGTRDLSGQFVRIDDYGYIHAYVDVTDVTNIQTDLERFGARLEIISDELNIVQAWIPFDVLAEVAKIDEVKRIRLPDYGRLRTGTVNTAGDLIHKANQLRSIGPDGTGIKVGIISDGASGVSTAQATGDLPASVTKFGTCGYVLNVYFCDEGTAMAEIVHDLAPGAELAIGAVFNTGAADSSLAFIDRVDELKNTFGADVIVDDIGFFTEPFFEDGPVADKVKEAVDAGVIYASAAGNESMIHYEDDYVENTDGHSWTASPGNSVHDFGLASGGSSDIGMGFTWPASGTFSFVFQWNDAFGSAGGAGGNDFAVVILNAAGDTEVARVDVTQNGVGGDDDPIEFPPVSFENSGGTATFQIAIEDVGGSGDPTNRRFEMFVFGDATGFEYLNTDGSVFGHPAVDGVLAVGAISSIDPGNDAIEPFSSLGPSRIFFPSEETRMKPDISAIDGVAVTGASEDPSFPFPSPFYGTSAAAPHIAGLAAQLLSGFTTPQEVIDALKNTAIDLGTTGADNTFGAGRANVFEAGDSLNSPPESAIDEPLDGATGAAGEAMAFSGTCTDPNGTGGATFLWTFGADSNLTDSAAEDPGDVVYSVAGTYAITFACTDGFGLADTTPDTISITVEEAVLSNSSSGGGCAVSENRSTPNGLFLSLLVVFVFVRRRQAGL